MARCMFLTRNRIDGATLSGGSWVATLPLTNLQDRRLSKVSRSSADSLAAAQFAADLGAEYHTRVVSLHGHNLSTAANVRVRGYQARTFARADTATYVNEDGVVTAAASGELRDWHYLTDNGSTFRRVTLLERTASNIALGSCSWADSTYWTNHAGFTIATATSIIDGQTAYKHTDAGGGALRSQIIGVFVNAQTDCASFIVEDVDGAGTAQFSIYDNTAGAHVHRVTYTYATHAVVTADGAGTSGVTNLANNRYRAWPTATGTGAGTGAAGNDRRIIVYPISGAGKSVIIHHAQLVAATSIPSSAIVTVASSDNRAADSLTIALKDTTPKAATYLYEGVVCDLPNHGTTVVWLSMGNGGGATAAIRLYMPSGTARLYIAFHNGTSEVTGYWTTATLALGDYIAVRITQAADGAITAGLTIGTAAEDTTLDGAISTQALPTAWAANVVSFAGTNVNANHGLIRFIGQSGSYTTAQMQALNDGDIAYYAPYDSQWTAAYPAIYPAGVLAEGDPGYSDSKLAAEDWTDGYREDFIHVLTSAGTMRSTRARYWTVEVDDTANADGYVEIGRAWMDYGYQPTINMVVGSGLGWQTSSTVIESDGGEHIYDERPRKRAYSFAFGNMDEDESLVRFLEIQRKLGTTGQLLFITDPADTYHMHRRSFLATLRQLSPLQNKIAAYYDQAFELVEDI